jgi:hypothetical protein
LQVKASLDGHEETKSRILDIVHLKTHIEKVIASLRSKVADLPSQDGTNKAFKFMLAGYSWKMSEFRMWTFRYDVTTGEFNAHSARRSGNFLFMSDNSANEKGALVSLMRRIEVDPNASLRRLNWEPLKVLLDVIRDPSVPDIGGAPQMVKIYKHANTLPINVLWPTGESTFGVKQFEVTHLGRPLLGYERSRYLAMDPDTFELLEPWNIAKRLAVIQERETAAAQKRIRANLCGAIAALRDARALPVVLNRLVRDGASFQMIQRTIESSKGSPFSSWYSDLDTEP